MRGRGSLGERNRERRESWCTAEGTGSAVEYSEQVLRRLGAK
jgi:hypothetical protein